MKSGCSNRRSRQLSLATKNLVRHLVNVRTGADRGDVMLWVVVAAPFLLVGTIALVSASENWEARREAHAVAAAASRSAAQADPLLTRTNNSGASPDARTSAQQRAFDYVASQSGDTSYSATVDVSEYPNSVSVTVESTVDYTFSGFGMPLVVRGTASATALEGVTDGEQFEG